MQTTDRIGEAQTDEASDSYDSDPAEETVSADQVKIERLIRAVDNLPPVPRNISKALGMIDDPRTTASKLSSVVSGDLALTGKVLKMANSSYYGFPRKIKSIKEAIVILGFDTMKNLITASSMQKVIDREMPGYKLQKGELWRHSMACAMCAETLTNVLGRSDISGEEAFLAGLLHDMGKVVLDHFLREEYEKIMALVISDDISFYQAEQACLGFNHAEIGAKIATNWNLPLSIVQAIEFHHDPLKSKRSQVLASVVKMSDSICFTFGMGIGGEELDLDKEGELLDFLGVDRDVISDITYEIGETVESTIAQTEKGER